ncbi:MAG TPA: 2-oxoacid:ferredoxin oxidoreductase subunit beta, partial [Terriglobia bacterium]|nr:2-oxoacid:ferredoxin oxidoreductase subunit beta [Terriglobia bacterium]
DGSRIMLRKLDAAYDPTDRGAAQARVQERLKSGEYLTGLLYVDVGGAAEGARREFHQVNGTPEEPLNSLPYEALSPGSKGLAKILARYR